MKPKPNWFYPIVIWLCPAVFGSAAFCFFKISRNGFDLHAFTTELFFAILGSLFISLLSFIVSMIIFAVVSRKNKSKLLIGLLTALPHLLIILAIFLMVLISKPENIVLGAAHFLSYSIALLLPAFLLRPVKRV